MDITPTTLSIPPFISTTWKNIAALHIEDVPTPLTLVATLTTGAQIRIPHLDRATLEKIFTAHAQHLKQQTLSSATANNTSVSSLPLPFSPQMLSSMGNAMHHNPEQQNAPDLPAELLRQVSVFAQHLDVQDLDALPTPEPHCNCMHCQIAKALQAGMKSSIENSTAEEEPVLDEELKFREWDITEEEHHLFTVTHPLDPHEVYHVCLNPVGCTCGHSHCEHIRAVLSQ